MKTNQWISLVSVGAIALAVGGGGGWWWAKQTSRASQGRRGHQTSAAAPPSADHLAGPVVPVKVVPVKQGTVKQSLVAYGTVVAAPGKGQTWSVPFECRVLKVLVRSGQVIQKGTPLMQIEASVDAKLQLDEAKSDRDAAKHALAQVQQKLNIKLATQEQVITARQKYQAAELRVQSLEQRGIDGPQTIKASNHGLMSNIAVQQGQIVPAGTVLMQAIGRDAIEARLGIQSSDVRSLKVGQSVQLASVNAPDHTVTGTIRLITEQVNPQTRLVDVFVEPQRAGQLLLNGYVQGRTTIRSGTGLIVPVQAVQPIGNSHVLFTVSHGKAVKHTVEVGLSDGKYVKIEEGGLHVGDQVVVTGNYELKDGMAVTTEPTG